VLCVYVNLISEKNCFHAHVRERERVCVVCLTQPSFLEKNISYAHVRERERGMYVCVCD